MRLSRYLMPLAVFAVAAVASGFGARVAVSAVELRSAQGINRVLATEGMDWADALADGLQVILEGEAPSEAMRFRAITLAGSVVDASRVIDNMTVADSFDIAPPAFSMEILRNDSGVSIIGLVPATTDREALSVRVLAAASGKEVTDLLETADYPEPDGWSEAMDFALIALSRLPRSKISVEAGEVEITAIADSDAERRRLETDLARLRPDETILALSISAPRPVVTPFITRFILDADGARFDVCTADSAEAAARIIRAARQAGLEGKADCPLALGVPSATWGDAVSQAITAVEDLGGGVVTISDADISLVAVQGTAQARFDQIVGRLENDLPDLFALEATLPQAPEPGSFGPPQFTATRSPEGLVQLRGRVSDALMNQTAQNYAQAKFGTASITMGTRISEDLPGDWSVRVLAGIDALAELSSGAVIVEPDRIEVVGKSGETDAGVAITRDLIARFGEAARIDVSVEYVEALDPIAALPTPEECLEQITVVKSSRKITFDPGSATLAGDATVIMDDIAEILRRCGDLRLEVAGYTDSQGSEEGNLRLSQQRADAVLEALRERRVPVASFTALGYGEANPIADNDTEAGREANRRIEFSLIRAADANESSALDELAAENEESGAEGTEAEATDAETQDQ